MNSFASSSGPTATDGTSNPTNRNSNKPNSRIRDFALGGRSDPPDPATHAYRKDLADVALAGRVVASHYAQPVARELRCATTLRKEDDSDAPAIAELAEGAPFLLLDWRGDWVWGYGGEEKLVGYVRADALR